MLYVLCKGKKYNAIQLNWATDDSNQWIQFTLLIHPILFVYIAEVSHSFQQKIEWIKHGEKNMNILTIDFLA